MNQETSAIPSGKVTYQLEDGRELTLPLTTTVQNAYRKGAELHKEGRDQLAFLEWFAQHVSEKSGVQIDADYADGLFDRMEADYLQKKTRRKPTADTPSSPASTSSTPSA